MINKVSEEWGRIEQESKRGDELDPQRLQELLKSVAGVRATLRRMCDVSVTRTTLRDAIREALVPVLKEYGAELFPEVFEELAQLRSRVEAISAASGFSALPEEVQGSLAGIGTRLDEAESGVQSLKGQLEEADKRREGELGALKEDFEQQLRGGLLAVEEKLENARKHFTQLLDRIEASVPATVQEKTEALEAQLRKEIDEMVHGLEEKLTDLQGILTRMEDVLPSKEVLDGVDQRLARLEARFETVSAQIRNIDSVTPEIRMLEEKFTAVRELLGSISSGVGEAGHGIGDLQTSISSSLAELRSVLDEGIQRWESDQSRTLERLSAIRDTLRDQLGEVSRQVTQQGKSIWGKLSGKGEGGVKLTAEQWQRLAGKLEGIISGLESVLAEKSE